MLPRDTRGRPLHDLRISVTDRCNFRCVYCMPRAVFGRDHAFLPRAELLTFDEIARLVGILTRLGVQKVRLTGGEPLVRRELPTLVAMLAATPGVKDLTLTTNGVLLPEHAPALREALHTGASYEALVATGTIGLLGEQSASAFLLWATGVKSCGSDVTAKCVLDSAAKQTDWTGGGLHIPADPGSNTASKCGMLLKLKGAEWVKVVPSGDTLFDCNDKYLVEGITTSAVTAASSSGESA